MSTAASEKLSDLIQAYWAAPIRCGITGALPQRRHPQPQLTPPIPVSRGQRQALLRPLSQKRSVCFSAGQTWTAELIPLGEPTSPAVWPAWDEGGAWLGTWRMGSPPPVSGGGGGKAASPGDLQSQAVQALSEETRNSFLCLPLTVDNGCCGR